MILSLINEVFIVFCTFSGWVIDNPGWIQDKMFPFYHSVKDFSKVPSKKISQRKALMDLVKQDRWFRRLDSEEVWWRVVPRWPVLVGCGAMQEEKKMRQCAFLENDDTTRVRSEAFWFGKERQVIDYECKRLLK